MRFRSHSAGRLVAGALALAILFVPFAAAPVSSAPPMIRAVSTMSLNERMTLPAATVVTLRAGRTVSLGVLRSEHQARLKRFTIAASLGRSVKAGFAPRTSFIKPRYVGSTAMFKYATVVGTHVVPKPISTSGVHTVLGQVASGQNPGVFGSTAPPGPGVTVTAAPTITLVPLQGWGKTGYAQDYQDFCSSTGASACLYLPANTTFYLDPTGIASDNAVTGTYYVMDNDPLILDPKLCKFYGGSEWAGGDGCVYSYPINYFANFFPGNLPTTASGTCDSPASYYIDPKGAVRVNYTPPATTLAANNWFANGQQFSTGASAITCTLQIWTSSK